MYKRSVIAGVLDLTLNYIFYIFIAITAINAGYYLFLYVFAFAKAKQQNPEYLPPISVIICAKNEAENLKQNIPKWLEQKYDNFELVIINDASIDGTDTIIENFALRDTRITQVNVENNEAFWGSKKYALTLGIKKATHAHLLLTDADCCPASNQWIEGMASNFVSKKELVLGYGAYKKEKGSFLNKLIRFETVVTAMQYFGYAMLGRPYMGVGRNLAYTSRLFYEQRGFINHMKLQSGDDDLFVNEAGTKENTTVCFDPDTFTISEPKRTFSEWYTQKRRHINVAGHYHFWDTFFLGLFYISQLLFFAVAIVLLSFLWQWEIVLGIMGVRYLIAWLAIGGSAFRLREKDLVIFYPFLELFLIFFQLSIFISNLISKPNRWK